MRDLDCQAVLPLFVIKERKRMAQNFVFFNFYLQCDLLCDKMDLEALRMKKGGKAHV